MVPYSIPQKRRRAPAAGIGYRDTCFGVHPNEPGLYPIESKNFLTDLSARRTLLDPRYWFAVEAARKLGLTMPLFWCLILVRVGRRYATADHRARSTCSAAAAASSADDKAAHRRPCRNARR